MFIEETLPDVSRLPAAAVPLRGAVIAAVTSPAPLDVWQQLMADDPDALPYQSPEWSQAACATGRFVDVSRLYEMADGQRFVVPLLARPGLPRWLNLAASMPSSWGIGGIVGSAPLTPAALAAILDDICRAGFLSVRIRPNPLHAAAWKTAGIGTVIPRRAHVLDLEGGFDAVWSKRFSSRARSVIRKAERAIEVEFASGNRLLPQFYALLEKSFLRWAAIQHEPRTLAIWRAKQRDPYSRFETAAAAMGDALRVGIASIGGRLVASIVVLRGRNVNYSRGAIDAGLIANSGASELLHRHAIEDAAQSGSRYYHMGESGLSASLSRFKEKLGATPYDYAEYRIERLPVTRAEGAAKALVKRLIGFKDVG